MDAVMAALYSGSTSALWGAFAWGMAGVLISPCGMAVIPLVVGYIQTSRTSSYWGSFCISVVFSSGIFANLLLVGLLTSGAGSVVARYDYWLSRIVGVVFILIGLHLAGLIRIPWFQGKAMDGNGKKGLKGALALGLFSGLALGPCSFAFALPILSLSAQTSALNPLLGVSMVVAYGLGHCSVLVLAGTFSEWIGKYLRWGGETRLLKVFSALCGLGLIAGGVYLLYTSFPMGTFFGH